jgi:hypothetical protein
MDMAGPSSPGWPGIQAGFGEHTCAAGYGCLPARCCSEAVSLLGIRQLYQLVSPSPSPSLERQPEWRRLFESRVAALLHILRSVSFHQASSAGAVWHPMQILARIWF